METVTDTHPMVAEADRVKTNVQNLNDFALAIEVKDDSQEAAALEFVKRVKVTSREAEDKLDELTAGAKSFVKTVAGLFKPHLDRLKTIESAVKLKMQTYRSEVIRKAEEERRKAVEAQRKAEAKAEKTGKPVKEVAIPDAPKQTVSSAGAAVTYRDVTRWEIEDPKKVPIAYWKLDEVKIGQAVRAGIPVPGVKTWVEPQAAIR